MTSIAKPPVKHPSSRTNGLGLTIRDYEGAMSTLCASLPVGAGSGTFLRIEASGGVLAPTSTVATILPAPSSLSSLRRIRSKLWPIPPVVRTTAPARCSNSPATSRDELTPRGTRKIGQKALGEIYSSLKKDSFGKLEIKDNGVLTPAQYDGTDAEIRSKYNFGARQTSDWTPGSHYEMSSPGAPSLLGEGQNIVVDPPRKLVHTFKLLMDPTVATIWLVRVLFLALLYLFLFGVVRVLLRDLRSAAREPVTALGRLRVVASEVDEPALDLPLADTPAKSPRRAASAFGSGPLPSSSAPMAALRRWRCNGAGR